ncbi:MAG: hypothetical protein GY874_08130 [Desulfobacteraceae bacterium]|nr:hypothetical protein [Desulfobacteraceae bacterium]
MDSVDRVIEQFGYTMDIEGFRLNDKGVIRLDIEDMGPFFIERCPEGLFIYLARHLQGYEERLLVQALAACHYDNELPLDVSVGYEKTGWLFFTVRLASENVTTPELEKTIEVLFDLYNYVSEQQ